MKTRQKIEYRKRDWVAQLAELFASAVSFINADKKRSPEMIEALLRALQLFEENRLAAVVAVAKDGADAPLPENFHELLSLKVEDLTVRDRTRRTLLSEGVWYVGELYRYLTALESASRQNTQLFLDVVNALTALGLPLDIDPIQVGWRPAYWYFPRVLRALNVPVIELRVYADAANEQHMQGIHYVGAFLRSVQSQPSMQFGEVQRWFDHTVASVGIHSGMYLPPDWVAPSEVPEAWARQTRTARAASG